MKLRVIFLSVFAGISLMVIAQGKFEIHGGVSVPSFEFRQTDTQYGGAAETGVNFGVKYIFSPATKGLSFTLGADCLLNDLNQDGKSSMESMMKNALTTSLQPYTYSNFSINHLSYLNIPVFAGVEYKLPVDKLTSLYLNGGLGPNYSKAGDMSVGFNFQGYDAKMTESFESKIGFAYQLGIGLLFQNQYSVHFGYNALGLNKYKNTTTFKMNGQSQSQDNTSTLDVRISTFSATFGIRF
jgi:hypothetical protein